MHADTVDGHMLARVIEEHMHDPAAVSAVQPQPLRRVATLPLDRDSCVPHAQLMQLRMRPRRRETRLQHDLPPGCMWHDAEEVLDQRHLRHAVCASAGLNAEPCTQCCDGGRRRPFSGRVEAERAARAAN